jgi:hypothetical protein
MRLLLKHKHKDSEDFAATTPVMKQIKRDGKKTGHARKYSDKIWAEFSGL